MNNNDYKFTKDEVLDIFKKGESLTYPQLALEMEEYIINNISDSRSGQIIYGLMVLLEDVKSGKPMEEIIEKFNSQYKDEYVRYVVRESMLFFPQGNSGIEFYKQTTVKGLSENERERINKVEIEKMENIRKRNEKFDSELEQKKHNRNNSEIDEFER